MRLISLLAVSLFFEFGCVSKEPPARGYSQNFKTPVAFLVAEGPSRKQIMASGFLIEKEKGIFMTAKHFTDVLAALGIDNCKIFFNGNVYEAEVVKVPPLRDAALLRVSEAFDASGFPEPFKPAAKKVKAGDRVFVLGLHPHPFLVRRINQKHGLTDRVVPIFREYYNYETRDQLKEQEVVFDSLEGKVDSVNIKIHISNEDPTNFVHRVRYETNLYFKVKTARDHLFSFAGLSGGPVLNEAGETVGLITAETPNIIWPDLKGNPLFDNILKLTFEVRFEDLYLTPIESVKDLYDYAKNAR